MSGSAISSVRRNSNSRLLWVLGLLLAAPFVTEAHPADDPEPVPAWFVQPPSSNGLWAVGYARTYATWTTSVAEAKADAYTRLRHRWAAQLTGERLYETTPGVPMTFRGARQERTPLRDTLRSVTYVDSARIGKLTVVLAHVPTTKGHSPAPVSALRRPFSETPPDWVDGGPAPEGPTVRAVGIAPRYYYPASSWALAEHYGWWTLAARAAARVDRLRQTTAGIQHTVTRVRASATLRRVRVVARWQDADACYVLLEASVRPRAVDP